MFLKFQGRGYPLGNGGGWGVGAVSPRGHLIPFGPYVITYTINFYFLVFIFHKDLLKIFPKNSSLFSVILVFMQLSRSLDW